MRYTLLSEIRRSGRVRTRRGSASNAAIARAVGTVTRRCIGFGSDHSTAATAAEESSKNQRNERNSGQTDRQGRQAHTRRGGIGWRGRSGVPLTRDCDAGATSGRRGRGDGMKLNEQSNMFASASYGSSCALSKAAITSASVRAAYACARNGQFDTFRPLTHEQSIESSSTLQCRLLLLSTVTYTNNSLNLRFFLR